jgi:hypothetical protein
MMQRWEKNAAPIKRVVARYAVGDGITSDFLTRKIREIIVALDCHKLIVNNITADGASENRSTFKTLATISMDKIFEKNNVTLTDNQRSIFPLEKKVAFHHPTRDDITIFIGGEMPHLIKKIVNAFERSAPGCKSTHLHFQGNEMSLKMLRDIWEYSKSNELIGSL